MATYLEMAKAAIDHVKSSNIQSANTVGAVVTDNLGLTSHGAKVGATQAKRGATFYGQAPYSNDAYAEEVVKDQAGNCADKTTVAYQYLYRNYDNEARFTVCSSNGYDHAFLIIHKEGRMTFMPGNQYNRVDFGDDAVLVDAWQHDYYKLNGAPSLNPRAWLVGPQQFKTRYQIWAHSIHVKESANAV